MTTLTATAPVAPATDAPARQIHAIPFSRLVRVELRKMFDTRAGFWLMASILILSVLASGAVILWAPDSALTQETFSSAIGMPMAVLLPVIAILSVTSEYSQRTGLTTFSLVPWRGRVFGAKLVSTLLIGLASMLVAVGVGALGTVLGSAIAGVDPVWNLELGQFGLIVLANVLGMLIGFTLGVVLRNSPAAIVAYFVYSLVLPGATGMLAAFQEWFADLQPWVDANHSITRLFDITPDARGWAQLAVACTLWIVVPLALGLRSALRAEVK